jgi:hypothetical protein
VYLVGVAGSEAMDMDDDDDFNSDTEDNEDACAMKACFTHPVHFNISVPELAVAAYPNMVVNSCDGAYHRSRLRQALGSSTYPALSMSGLNAKALTATRYWHFRTDDHHRHGKQCHNWVATIRGLVAYSQSAFYYIRFSACGSSRWRGRGPPTSTARRAFCSWTTSIKEHFKYGFRDRSPPRGLLILVFLRHVTTWIACVQDAMDAWERMGSHMPDELVMYYATELMRAAEALHKASVLHTCLVPRNVLLRHPDTYALHATGLGADPLTRTGYCCNALGANIDCSLNACPVPWQGHDQRGLAGGRQARLVQAWRPGH